MTIKLNETILPKIALRFRQLWFSFVSWNPEDMCFRLNDAVLYYSSIVLVHNKIVQLFNKFLNS